MFGRDSQNKSEIIAEICKDFIVLILCGISSPLECLHLLLAHGAPVKARNLQGWTALAEAVSYGDRLISEYFSGHVLVGTRDTIHASSVCDHLSHLVCFGLCQLDICMIHVWHKFQPALPVSPRKIGNTYPYWCCMWLGGLGRWYLEQWNLATGRFRVGSLAQSCTKVRF